MSSFVYLLGATAGGEGEDLVSLVVTACGGGESLVAPTPIANTMNKTINRAAAPAQICRRSL